MKKALSAGADLFTKLPLSSLTLRKLGAGEAVWKAREDPVPAGPASDCIIIFLVLEGYHEVHHGGKVTVVHSGQSYLIGPGASYQSIRRNGPKGLTKMRWMFFNAMIFQATNIASLLDLPFVLDRKITAKFNHVIDELNRNKEYKGESSAFLRLTREHQFGITALRILCEIASCKPDWRHILKDMDRLRNVISFVRENYKQKITLAKMAAKANLSLSQFGTVFYKKMGMTPLQFLRQVRLQEASHQLVTTDVSLRVLAEEMGFYDEFHFSRDFKKHFRLTPSAYRSMHQY